MRDFLYEECSYLKNNKAVLINKVYSPSYQIGRGHSKLPFISNEYYSEFVLEEGKFEIR